MAFLASIVVFSSLLIGASAQCGSPQRDHVNCANWKNSGFCTNSFYTAAQKQQFCGTACGLCTSPGGSCPDSSPNCGRWAANGFCTNTFYTADQRKQFCAGTCNLCNVGGATTPAAGADTTPAATTTGAAAATDCSVTVNNVVVPIPKGATAGTPGPDTATTATVQNIITAVTLPAGCTMDLKTGAGGAPTNVPASGAPPQGSETSDFAICKC